jgi:hypothetical protein
LKNKIVTAIFKDSTHTKVSDVWQYDYGQILRIQGLNLPTAVEVDFAVAGSSESIARIGTTKDGVTDVVIPDSLIETGNNLVAYIYLRDAESGNTEYQIDMLVTKRAKPEAYDRPEDKELFGQAIEAVNTAADRAEKARQTAQEAAQKAGLDAEQTAQDRVEVAKMVETVTDISEQVKKVEELSNKAQESATQAGTSATAAEKAKAQAETAAGKTAEDRTAVNQAKIDVDEVQKAVRADRAAVEEAKQSVEQLSNAIPESAQVGVQAVNQAKQTAVDEIARTGISHKTAVEGAGTQAVESVDNAKTTATEAVEIAKTEAVQAVQAEGTKQTGNVSAEGAKQIKEVQDKGAEVLQSIPENFATQMETKLNKQQGIENKGKVLVIGEDGNVVPEEVASGGGDGIAIINTMSGESPLAIPDSAERVNKRLELGGKTEQVQTSGKNLFDTKTYRDMNGCEIINNNQISFIQNLAKITYEIKLDSGDYRISFKRKKYSSITIRNGETVLHTNGGENDYGYNIKLSEPAVISVEFTSGQNPNAEQRYVYDIQLETGTTATPYEPYTGGKPSPSPEYPQEIKNVGKWNEETRKYEVDVKITGKNLFDKRLLEGGEVVEFNGVECYKYIDNPYNFKYKGKFENGQQYAFTLRILRSASKESNISDMVIVYTDGSMKQMRFRHGELKTFVSDNGKTIDYFSGAHNFSIDCYLDLSVTRLSVGGQDAGYDPYKEQTITLTSDRPITKWDRLVEQGGQIGWLYGTRDVIFTGDESWMMRTETDMSVWFVRYNCLPGIKTHNVAQNIGAYSNYALWERELANNRDGKFCTHGNPSNNFLLFGMSKDYTVETFKTWLREKNKSGKPMCLTYPTESTEFVPIQQSEQNAIRALKTYYPTTVITADGGELDPDIKVTYTADTKNYIDNKVSAKVASIIRQYRLNTANLLSLMPMETQAAMIENDTNNILENAEEMKHE